MKIRMSIREIEKNYKVGQEKAQMIQKMYYDQGFNGRPVAISKEEVEYIYYGTNFKVGYQRMFKVAQKDENFKAPDGKNEHHFRKIYDYDDLYLNSSDL